MGPATKSYANGHASEAGIDRNINQMSSWNIFKSAFRKDNPLHQHNRRWGVGILVAMSGLVYFVSLAEAKMRQEKDRKRDETDRESTASAHGSRPFVPMHR